MQHKPCFKVLPDSQHMQITAAHLNYPINIPYCFIRPSVYMFCICVLSPLIKSYTLYKISFCRASCKIFRYFLKSLTRYKSFKTQKIEDHVAHVQKCIQCIHRMIYLRSQSSQESSESLHSTQSTMLICSKSLSHTVISLSIMPCAIIYWLSSRNKIQV